MLGGCRAQPPNTNHQGEISPYVLALPPGLLAPQVNHLGGNYFDMTLHRADRIQGTQRICRGDFSTTNAARLHTGWVGFPPTVSWHSATHGRSLRHNCRGRLIG